DLSLVGLAVYEPDSDWDTVVKVPRGCETLHPVSGTPLYLRGSVYACVVGQLVRVDMGTQRVEGLSLSLCTQPRLSLTRDALVLDTPSGERYYPLRPFFMVADSHVESTPYGRVMGDMVGDGVVQGVALKPSTGGDINGRCYDVTRGVWTCLGLENEETEPVRRYSATSLKQLEGLLASCVAERVDITSVDGSLGVYCPIQFLSDRPIHDWTFTDCTISTMGGASVSKSRFVNCSFEKANLKQASFTGCTFTHCAFDSAQCESAVFTDVVFAEGCSMVGCCLVSATLTSVTLTGVPLTNVDLSKATLKGDVTGFDFTDCHLTNSDLSHVQGLTDTMLRQAVSLTGFKLTGYNMERWDLSGLDLSGATLSKVNFKGATMTNTVLTGAWLSGATGLDATQIRQVASVVGSKLCRLDLSGLNLSSINLSQTDLSSSDLSNATLTKCDLSSATLSNATLTGATLTGATLTGVIGLSDTQLRSMSSLRGANLSGRNMSSMNLSDINLDGADLTGTTLTGSTLTGVKGLSESQLRSVSSLRGASLSGVDLSNMDLSSVILINTDLRGCNLTGTVLLAKCGALLDFLRVPQFDRPVSGMEHYRFHTFHLTVPGLEGLEWRLAATGHVIIDCEGTRVMLNGSGSVRCSRTGSSIEFRGPVGTASIPCIPGIAARVEVRVHESNRYCASSVRVEL
ncbi:hypothetical protein KIPB_009369, partial [Kipferlia bialata]